jgi:hypothetical protein
MIDTSPIDAYRQGVELIQEKHYTKGLVKIHSGEPGHVLKQSVFGINRNHHYKNDYFSDASKYVPGDDITENDLPTSGYEQSFDAEIYDGVLEPLQVRTYKNNCIHTIKGEFGGAKSERGTFVDIVTIDMRQMNSWYSDDRDLSLGDDYSKSIPWEEKNKLGNIVKPATILSSHGDYPITFAGTEELIICIGSVNKKGGNYVVDSTEYTVSFPNDTLTVDEIIDEINAIVPSVASKYSVDQILFTSTLKGEYSFIFLAKSTQQFIDMGLDGITIPDVVYSNYKAPADEGGHSRISTIEKYVSYGIGLWSEEYSSAMNILDAYIDLENAALKSSTGNYNYDSIAYGDMVY